MLSDVDSERGRNEDAAPVPARKMALWLRWLLHDVLVGFNLGIVLLGVLIAVGVVHVALHTSAPPGTSDEQWARFALAVFWQEVTILLATAAVLFGMNFGFYWLLIEEPVRERKRVRVKRIAFLYSLFLSLLWVGLAARGCQEAYLFKPQYEGQRN